MDSTLQQKLAELALQVGVNLQKDQCLVIRTGLGSYRFAQRMAEEAYRMGARYVRLDIMDSILLRSRVLHSSTENLRYMPEDIVARGHVEVDETWARIRIENTEETKVLSDAPSEALSELVKHATAKLEFVKDSVMNHNHPWLVMTYPGKTWAGIVYDLPEHASNAEQEEALRKFEEQYIRILRLDAPDPIATWRELENTLIERGRAMNDMKLDSLHFQSAETDLSIGLCEKHIWCGGPAELPNGMFHEPNLPTEEVFTAPDYRRAEGRVRATRPVNVDGVVVDGAWFVFKGGKVVDCGASRGADILEKTLSYDAQARSLGEVALVDANTPIYQSGLVFQTTLFDENAACHIALGAAYPTCITGGRDLRTPEALMAEGCNVSLIHKDFMISDESTNVTGYTKDGTSIPLIRGGSFTF